MTAKIKPISLKEIAQRLSAHLKRIEGDPAINVRLEPENPDSVRHYYHAYASYSTGAYIYLVYVAYQDGTSMKRAEAAEYLEWLDAGNNGDHCRMQVAKKQAAITYHILVQDGDSHWFVIHDAQRADWGRFATSRMETRQVGTCRPMRWRWAAPLL